VSMSALMTTAASDKQPIKQPKTAATTSQTAASRLIKKSKLVQVSLIFFSAHDITLEQPNALYYCQAPLTLC